MVPTSQTRIDRGADPYMVPIEGRGGSSADPHMVPIEGRGGSSADPATVRIDGDGLSDTEWVRTTGRPSLFADHGGAVDDARRSGAPTPEWERMKGRKSGDPDVTSAEGSTSSTPSPDWERMMRRKGQDADPAIEDADAATPADAAEWERMRRRKKQDADPAIVDADATTPADAAEWERMQRRKKQDADPAIEDEDGQKTSSPEWREMKRRRRISEPGLRRTPRERDAETGSGGSEDGGTSSSPPLADIDATGTDKGPADDPIGRRFDPRPAEAVVRSFTDELKTAAHQIGSDITITQADRMKVEISSREKALVLFFAWRDLDFDRIVLRETPIPSTGEDEAPKKSGLHGVRETLMRILGRRLTGEEEQTTFLRVAPVRESGSPMLQWQDADQPNGSDDLVAKMRTAMAVRYVDPDTGRDWFIELVSDGSKKNLNSGKGKAGRDLDVRGAKRNALLMLQGLMSAIDDERSQP